MQLKSTDLVSLQQRLIPSSLAFAFGIAEEGDSHNAFAKDAFPGDSSHRSGSSQRYPLPSCKRQYSDDAADGPSGEFGMQHSVRSLQQQQQDSAMAQAAANMQAAQAMAQAAASLQAAQQGINAQYQRHNAASAQAAAMNQAATQQAAYAQQLRGFSATAYRLNPQSLMPYMAATPQGMSLSNMTGSMGCPPMSAYAASQEYSTMASMGKQDEEQEDTQARALKRPRLVWTPQLHKLFEEAVQKLGLDKAVPKTIMQVMNVEGLTRENVASHLQKYRLSLKRSADGHGAKAAGDAGEGSADKTGGDSVGAVVGAAGGSSDGEGSQGKPVASAGAGASSSSGIADDSSSKDRVDRHDEQGGGASPNPPDPHGGAAAAATAASPGNAKLNVSTTAAGVHLQQQAT